MAAGGVCGIWAMRAGDLLAQGFEGSTNGLNSAVTYCGSNGTIHVYPGNSTLTIPAIPAGVRLIKHEAGIETQYAQGGVLRPEVNAREYATIQAAHDALPSTGGVVYIPAGTYTPTTVPAYTGLTISKSNVKIVGDGHDTTTLQLVGAAYKDTHNINITAAENVTIEDLLLRGADTIATTEDLGIGIRLHVNGFGRLSVNRVRIIETGSWSVSVMPASAGSFVGFCDFRKLYCDDAKQGGSVRIGGSSLPCNGFLFTSCQLNGPPSGTYGANALTRGLVHITTSYAIHFDRCSFEDISCGTAVSTTGLSYNCTWTSCHFETNQLLGDLGGHWITASTGTNLYHFTWKNCTFLRLGAVNRGAMLLKTDDDTNILGWVFEDCRVRFDKTADTATDDIVLGAGSRGLSMIRCDRLHSTLAEQSWTISGAGAGRVEFIEKPRGLLADTFATTYTPDAKLAETIKLTLTDNITIAAPTLPQAGLRLTFLLIQDGTGGRTVTWNAVFKHAWSDTGNTLNKRSTITFVYFNGEWSQVGAQSAYI